MSRVDIFLKRYQLPLNPGANYTTILFPQRPYILSILQTVLTTDSGVLRSRCINLYCEVFTACYTAQNCSSFSLFPTHDSGSCHHHQTCAGNKPHKMPQCQLPHIFNTSNGTILYHSFRFEFTVKEASFLICYSTIYRYSSRCK